MQSSHSRRTDDHRIQEAICESGDRDLFPEMEIPRSTLRSWIHRGIPDVLTCDPTTGDRAYLLAEIHRYQRRTALLGAIVGLLIAMLRVSRVRLDYERLPEGDTKKVLLRAIGRAGKVLSLSAALRITRRSSSRYHNGVSPRPGATWMISQAARRHESLFARNHRSLLAAHPVVDTRRSPRQWRDLRDLARSRC